MKKIGIIGIGNPLRSDDGIGIFLLQKLVKQKKVLPKEIEFIDGGTGGMNLLHIIVNFDIVIVIDAININSKPGEYRIFTADEIIENENKYFLSTHENNLLQVIQTSKKLGEFPKHFFIFGIQPKDISYNPSLSIELKNKAGGLLKYLKKEIKIILSNYNLEQ